MFHESNHRPTKLSYSKFATTIKGLLSFESFIDLIIVCA